MTHPFSQTLLDWYATHGRELPWRGTTDPYRIWISEIILQQTRVAQGYDYYLRFMERFPTVEVLAAATEDEVLHRWEGLGYYSRARNLHAAAQQIVAQGGFPRDYAGVRALKGVGDYTAAAICSFAYGLPTAVVDGNVYRVLARYFAIDTPIDVAAGKKEFAQLADSLMVPERAADYNQAIMDFGAVQCTPRAPRCLICPLVETCAARQTGQVEDYPVKSKKVTVTHRYFTYILLVDTSAEEPALLIRRRPSGDIWQGLYEPLLIETPAPITAEEVEAHPDWKSCGLGEAPFEMLVRDLKHELTHRRLHVDAYVVRAAVPPLADWLRVPLTALADYAFPKVVNLLCERAFTPSSE
jgi:A/G-specific adenine glycosylase